MGTKDHHGVLRFDHLEFSPKLTVIETLSNGAEVLFRKPQGRHPMDNYLDVVLCWWSGQFVTWSRNLQTQGLDNGHYFVPEYRLVPHEILARLFIEALIDFDQRGIHTTLASKAAERLGVSTQDLTAA